MARPSTADPVEKFRFSVQVISVDLSITAGIDAFANFAFSDDQSNVAGLLVLSRSGFNEIELPSVEIPEITWRENIDAQRFIKLPGLAKYKPVVLKRGVTDSRDLYNWYRLVNNDLLLNNVSTELGFNKIKAPNQNGNFRKEVIITVHNRFGEEVKKWILFNAFPSSFTPGNNLNASLNEKLIEELSLSYEYFIELTGGNDSFSKELARDAIENAANLLIGELLPPSFTR